MHVTWSKGLHPFCSFSRLDLLSPFPTTLLTWSVLSWGSQWVLLHFTAVESLHRLSPSITNLTTSRSKAQLLRTTAETHGPGNEGNLLFEGLSESTECAAVTNSTFNSTFLLQDDVSDENTPSAQRNSCPYLGQRLLFPSYPYQTPLVLPLFSLGWVFRALSNVMQHCTSQCPSGTLELHKHLLNPTHSGPNWIAQLISQSPGE